MTATESLGQAVTSCRRILKAVADHVLPGVPGAASTSGNSLVQEISEANVARFFMDESAILLEWKQEFESYEIV